ncbi:MAG: hypothetical protein JRF72_19055 [Deltaproteobacteria bacterium]|jgi:hypothetical protein|nr:hypothetical protein [Deltaproteobacteria bacterium]
MKFTPEHFDDLRCKARDINASNLTRNLFASIINDMEKIHNMIVETEIDLTRHDENGAVVCDDSACDRFGV